MDADAETAAPRERGSRGRGHRGRGRGRSRGRGRGRGAAAHNGEDAPHHVEIESTARIEEIVDTDDAAPAEAVQGEAVVEETTVLEGEQDERGNGRRRGRGRGRGYNRRGRRGRGRGGALAEDTPANAGEGEQGASANEARPPRRRKEWSYRPHPTHFISLPIGHHAELRETVSSFTNALLANDPPIAGLDPSIILNPRRIHLTLGVMALARKPKSPPASPSAENSDQRTPSGRPTLTAAIEHLESLKPQIIQFLAGKKLQVELDLMDIMRNWGADPSKAHVMWAGPSDGGELAERLKGVASIVNESFKSAGFLMDEHRSLTLHCTLINTLYRKPREDYGSRTPFSFTSILASSALRAIAREPDSLAVALDGPSADAETNSAQDVKGKGRARARTEPVRVNLGIWDIDEVQICEMGSHGPEDEYVCVGKIALD